MKKKELENVIEAVRVYSDNIGMEYGIGNVLIMESGKRQMTEGIELPNLEKISTLEEKEP